VQRWNRQELVAAREKVGSTLSRLRGCENLFSHGVARLANQLAAVDHGRVACMLFALNQFYFHSHGTRVLTSPALGILPLLRLSYIFT